MKVATSTKTPSETVNVKSAVPFKSAPGVIVAVQFGAEPENTTPPADTKAVFDDEIVIEVLQFNVESISSIVKLTGIAVSSFVDCAPIAEIIGASAMLFTVNVNVSASVKKVSETVNVKSAVPNRSAPGVIVAIQLGAVPLITMLAAEAKLGFVDEILIEVLQSNVESASVMLNATGTATSSFVLWAPIAAITGASLIGLTVKVKVSESCKFGVALS